MGAMTGLSYINFEAFAERFDFEVRDLVRHSATTELLSVDRETALHALRFDLPPVESIAKKAIARQGLSERVSTAAGDFFVDPLPEADVITMGMILHDWNLEKKHLVRSAYAALPRAVRSPSDRGLIDDERRQRRIRPNDVPQHAHRVRRLLRLLRRRLPGLVPRGGASPLRGLLHLAGPSSAAIAYK